MSDKPDLKTTDCKDNIEFTSKPLRADFKKSHSELREMYLELNDRNQNNVDEIKLYKKRLKEIKEELEYCLKCCRPMYRIRELVKKMKVELGENS